MNSERSTIVFNQKAGNGKAKMLAGYLSDSLKGAPVVPFEQFLREKNHNGHVDVVWSIGGDGTHTSVARASRNGEATSHIVPLDLGTFGLIPKTLGTDKRCWGLERQRHYAKRLTERVKNGAEVTTIYPGTMEFSSGNQAIITWLWMVSTGCISIPFMDELERKRGKAGRMKRLSSAFSRSVRSLYSYGEPTEISVNGDGEKVHEAIIMKYPLIPGFRNPSRGENDALWTVPVNEDDRLRLVVAVLRDTYRILTGRDVTGKGIMERGLNGTEEIIFPASAHGMFDNKMGIDSELYQVSEPVTIYSRDTTRSPYRLLRFG